MKELVVAGSRTLVVILLTIWPDDRLRVLGVGFPGELPPLLLLSQPATATTEVPLDTPVVFTFSKPMAPEFAITWSANIDPSLFTCTWSQDQRVLTCRYDIDFPSGALITWELDPLVFKDQQGMPLFAFNISGSFVTVGGSGPDPCEPAGTPPMVLEIIKSYEFNQPDNLPPTLGTNSTFTASLLSTNLNPVTDVIVTASSGQAARLESDPLAPLSRFYFESFPTGTALEQAFPAGDYTVSANREDGSNLTAAISLPPSDGISTPQLVNLIEARFLDPEQDFLLQWLPFEGATTNDSIFFELSGQEGGVYFSAPDPCVPRELTPTDTAIVLPKNTFRIAETYRGSLAFIRNAPPSGISTPGLTLKGRVIKRTHFELRIRGVQFDAIVPQADGSVSLRIAAQAGRRVTIDYSSDLLEWTNLLSTNASTHTFEYIDTSTPGVLQRFYRARME